MLRKVSDIKGCRLRATNGVIGRGKELYFSDEHWTVEYLVANTGNWMHGWDVLIPTLAVRSICNAQKRLIDVNLTKSQIESSPSVQENPPVSLRFHIQHHRHLEWPYDWQKPAWFRNFSPPDNRYLSDSAQSAPALHQPADVPGWQSTHEVAGYSVEARNGKAGVVKDFIFDDANWTVNYIVVKTRGWWTSNQVLVPTDKVASVVWSSASVTVELDCATIRNAPQFDLSTPISRDYEAKVRYYYFGDTRQEWHLAA